MAENKNFGYMDRPIGNSYYLLNNYEAIGKFERTDSIDKKAAIVTDLEDEGVISGIVLAGDLSLSLSYLHDDIDHKIAFFNRAKEDWERALKVQSYRSNHTDAVVGRAAISLVFLKQHRALNFYDQLASPEDQDQTYRRLIEIGQRCLEGWDYYENLRKISHCHELAGVVSEIDVLLLLLRFTRTLGDSSWAPLPALVTQDRGKRVTDQTMARNGWDIGVYTHTDETKAPELTYKIQVKTDRNQRIKSDKIDQASIKYDDDIVVVYARNDLSLDPNFRMARNFVINTCNEELHAPNSKSRRPLSRKLNQQTDKLLEIIG